MQDLDNFKNIVSSSDILRERWLTISSQVIEEIHQRYGELLDREAVMQLSNVRISVLTGDEMDWRPEALANLPQLRRATELAEIKAKIESEDAAEAVAAEFDGLSPTERMARSRELGLEKREEPTRLTVEEQAKEVARINALPLSGAAKLAEARKAGLSF